MKALCNREDLLKAFSMVSGVAPARSPKPILQCVRFDAGILGDDNNNESTLLANDLEVGIRHRVLGVKVDLFGSCILPVARFGQILRAVPDEEIAIETDGDHVVIRGLRSEFRLPSEDPTLFPDVPDFETPAYYEIASFDLRRLIRRTIFATDAESTRYALGGVLFEMGSEAITAVATDGRRLSRQTIAAKTDGSPPSLVGAPVVPSKALKLIDRVMGDSGDPVHVAFSGTASVFVRTPQATIFSRLVEGRFPRYQDIFPATCEAKIRMKVGELRQAVQQAAIVTSDESRGVDFIFHHNVLALHATASDVGSSSIGLPINHEGSRIELTIDPSYLLDALKTLDDDSEIAAELIDGKSAVVFKTEDRFTYVVMPLTRDR